MTHNPLYDEISQSLRKSSLNTIPTCGTKHSRNYVIPGWNDYVKDQHQDARNSYVLWRNSGKPRQGPIADTMRRSRLNCKYALRQCHAMEDTARADAMAKSLQNKDVRGFWRSVSKHYNKAISLATTVGGATNPDDITNIWKDHFEGLLNSAKPNSSTNHVNSVLANISGCDQITVTPQMVSSAIQKLKTGKSCGNDGLAAEHYKHADARLSVLLSIFYTCTISHGYLPDDFMKTVIVPLVKNKTGDTSDVNNYRPIALVTVASKIFENVLLDILEPFLYTCDNQFGFKKSHSTDHCIYVMKNVIDYCRSYNSSVYSCFLDATKCFDKINHCTLFHKLIQRGIPLLLVRLLVYWYRNQTFNVKWGNSTSSYFHVKNGVRQGGILSPYLFTIYVNDLSKKLNTSMVGLHMCNICINHIFYADDLCIMSSSPAGLQMLLNICASYALENDIVINHKKSMYTVFKPDKFKLACPDIFIDGSPLTMVENAKYLGVTLNDRCRDDNDIRRHLRSFYMRANTVIRKFNNCTLDIKLMLFRSYCLPSYCSHLWYRYNKCLYSKVRVAFNNGYRRILSFSKRDSASFMFATCRVDNFDCFMRKNIYNFIQRLNNIDNEIVKSVRNCSMYT